MRVYRVLDELGDNDEEIEPMTMKRNIRGSRISIERAPRYMCEMTCSIGSAPL